MSGYSLAVIAVGVLLAFVLLWWINWCITWSKYPPRAQDYQPLFADVTTSWYIWFAWRPTETVDRGWRWMRFVWRRRVQSKVHLPGPQMTWYQTAVSPIHTRGET